MSQLSQALSWFEFTNFFLPNWMKSTTVQLSEETAFFENLDSRIDQNQLKEALEIYKTRILMHIGIIGLSLMFMVACSCSFLSTSFWICSFGSTMFLTLLLSIRYETRGTKPILFLILSYFFLLDFGYHFLSTPTPNSNLNTDNSLSSLLLIILPSLPLGAMFFIGNKSALSFVVWSILSQTSFAIFLQENIEYSSYICIVLQQILPILLFKLFQYEAQLYQDLFLKFVQFSNQRSKQKTLFVSRISHDLRTPLHGLLSSVQLIKQTKLTKEQATYLSTIDACGELLLSIIEKILDITRIESGKVITVKQQFNLFSLVEKIFDSLSSLAHAKNIKLLIEFDLHPSSYDVEGDQGHLREILLNLVGNSIKFTNEGFVKISVAQKEESDQTYFYFEIQDTGTGIDQQSLQSLFTPFSQGKTGQKKSEGSGLGLSIVKNFVQSLGGKMGVQSEVGVGSTFWFQVPLVILPPSTCLRTLDIDPQDQEKKIGLLSNGVILSSLQFYLEKWCLNFCILKNENDPLDFDLIVIDQNFDTLRHVLENLENQEASPKILLLSTVNDYSLVRKMLNDYPDYTHLVSVLITPFGPLKLSKALAALLSNRKGSQNFIGSSSSESLSTHEGSEDPPIKKIFKESKKKEKEKEKDGASIDQNEKLKKTKMRLDVLDNRDTSTGNLNENRPIQVLIVEDNAINQLVMKMQLEKLGIRFHITPSGEDAISIVEKSAVPIPLIFMDVEIEGKYDGFETTLKIREIEEERQSENKSFVIMMTGRALEDDQEKAKSSQVNEFLSKPVSLERVQQLVSRALNL